MSLEIRAEVAGDRDDVASLLEAAFGGPEEARILERLRRLGDDCLCLVAHEDGVLVGCICFSPVAVEGLDASA
ncbi:MAG: GNAT family N-acetyltransferase, partial [Thermoanaerobaculia bacterium]|nr:GNAT family N-acetyltransferase [Thermoanaerobaculia bacterium]